MQLGDRKRLVAAVAYGLFVVLVFLIIWGPWLAYFYVPEPQLEQEVIEHARHNPDDGLLRELGSYDLYPPLSWATDKHLVNAAEQLLMGQVSLPGFPADTVATPFSASKMASGPTMWQLFLHSFGLPRVLLGAYKIDSRPEFLDAVADYILAYDAYEHSAWKPGGFLWSDTWRRYPRNDHAVASRVPVLTDFWRLYRRSPNYRPEVGQAVLRMVARAAHLVSDPAQFTVATNHGVMQNLAACNAALAFPSLSGVEGHCRLAFRRLDEQLAFFINDEGFVLEHSPGYQSFSLRLIGIALRQMTLAKIPIPPSWLRKYDAAQLVYADLRRPDGSLPMFGDTDGGRDGEGPVIAKIDGQGKASPLTPRRWRPGNNELLAPVAGYALWWDGLEDWPNPRAVGHTAVAWSNFPGMGHKHADELSLAIWARGTPWWGNVGYWPYDTGGRTLAESWQGSNAPHLLDESEDGTRETRVLYHGRDDDLALLDLERHGPQSNRVRRQVVHVGKHAWIVVDTSAGVEGSRTRTIWTTSPAVRMAERAVAGEYTLTDKRSGQSLQAFFLGSPGTTRSLSEGNQSAFAGWSVANGNVLPAQAVVVEGPAVGAWQLAYWSLAGNTDSSRASGSLLAASPRMVRWEGADDWKLVLPVAGGEFSLERHHERIALTTAQGRVESLKLNPGSDVSEDTAKLRDALKAASAKYGAADMSGIYRLKVTAVLSITLLLGVALLVIVQRIRPTMALPVEVVLATGWLLMSSYFIFLRAQLI